MQISHNISKKQIKLTISNKIVSVMERLNPKKKFYIVGNIYGNHITINSRTKRGAMRRLPHSIVAHKLHLIK